MRGRENKIYNIKLVADDKEILEGEYTRQELDQLIAAFLQVYRNRVNKLNNHIDKKERRK